MVINFQAKGFSTFWMSDFEIKVLMQDNTTYLTAKADATKRKLQGGT